MQIALNTRDPYHVIYRGQKGALVNLDVTTNDILVGPDEGSLFAGNPECFILGALNSVMMDATRDWWAIAVTGNPVVAFMEGANNWNPSPAQIQEQLNALGLATEATQQQVKTNTSTTATNVSTVNTTLGVPAQTADIGALHAPGKTVANEVSVTGAPLLKLNKNAGFATGAALGASTTVTLVNNLAVTQIGLQMTLWLEYLTPTPTVPFGELSFIWSDTTSGLSGPVDVYDLPGGQSAFSVFQIDMPARSTNVTIKLTNLDPALTLTYSWTVNQISTPIEVPRVAETTLSVVAGFTRPGGDPLKGLLASVSVTITTGASQSRLVPTWAGRARLVMDNSAGIDQLTLSLLDPTGTLYSSVGSDTVGGIFEVAAGASATAEVALPNGPVVMKVANTGTGGSNITPTINLVRFEG